MSHVKSYYCRFLFSVPILTYIKPILTTKNLYIKEKSKIETFDRFDIVYKLKHQQYMNKYYTGQTIQKLLARIALHVYDQSYSKGNTALCNKIKKFNKM